MVIVCAMQASLVSQYNLYVDMYMYMYVHVASNIMYMYHSVLSKRLVFTGHKLRVGTYTERPSVCIRANHRIRMGGGHSHRDGRLLQTLQYSHGWMVL